MHIWGSRLGMANSTTSHDGAKVNNGSTRPQNPPHDAVPIRGTQPLPKEEVLWTTEPISVCPKQDLSVSTSVLMATSTIRMTSKVITWFKIWPSCDHQVLASRKAITTSLGSAHTLMLKKKKNTTSRLVFYASSMTLIFLSLENQCPKNMWLFFFVAYSQSYLRYMNSKEPNCLEFCSRLHQSRLWRVNELVMLSCPCGLSTDTHWMWSLGSHSYLLLLS